MIRFFLTAFLICTAGASLSAASVPNPFDRTVTPGVWCGNFHSATNYAAQSDIPLVLVWGKVGCGHCDNLHEALWTTAGQAWAAGQNAVFCYVEGTTYFEDTPPNEGAGDFAGGIRGDPDYLSGTPFVRFYWPGRASLRFSGQSLPSSSEQPLSASGLAALLAEFEGRYAAFIAGVDVGASHAAFPMGDYPCDRLEAIVGTTAYVDVPLVRTNATEKSATCRLRFTAGGVPSETPVSWAEYETQKFVRYALPSGLAAGSQIEVSLLEANGASVAVRHIWCLAGVENSPKNPYWLGEKTVDTLNWGEWSMDLDVVRGKVSAWNAAHPGDRAYAMMFVGGSTWCPDCAMAEANFFSRSEVKGWAVRNKVVFGVLDIPNNPQAVEASPSQLRYESSRTSDAFVTLRGTVPADEHERYQSGAGYLSRHSVPYEQALAVAARNAFLMGHDTLNGGWNRPERTNKNRTGVPVLILLRDDGTIAARWNRFSDVGPAAYAEGYLRRFEEIMRQVDDPNEESDDDRSTTRRMIATGDAVSSTVSSVDAADVYRIADAVPNRVMRFAVSGGCAADLRASVIDGATGTEIATATGVASSGFPLTAKLGTSASYFLKIAPARIEDGTFFGYVNDASTVCGYSVSVTSEMSGGEFGFEIASTNVVETCGTVVIGVRRKAGSAGGASVRVKLVEKSGEAVDERIEWTDAPLSWSDGEEGTKTAVLKVKADGLVRHDLQLGFELAELLGSASDLKISSGRMIVHVHDADIFGKPVYRGVAFADVREVQGYQSGDQIWVAPYQGALPGGFSLQSVGGSVRVTGFATSAGGEYSASYWVSLGRNGQVVSTQLMTFDFTVIDYDFSGLVPSLAEARTYGNLPLVANGAVQGLLTVTVPTDGQVSAKYVSGGRSYAYSAPGWSSVDWNRGVLTASAASTTEDGLTMSVTLAPTGGQAVFADPITGERRVFELAANPWPEGAGAWRGQYTVQLPQTNVTDAVARLGGSAYLALRMASDESVASGSMLYAGVLPNGRAVYGVSTLIAGAWPKALLPFYHVSDMRTSPYAFSGELAIAANAASDYRRFRWSVSAELTPVWEVLDGLGHVSSFEVYGGYYDRDEAAARFNEDFAGELDNFALVAETASVASGWYGLGVAWLPVVAEMTADNVPKLVAGATNPQGTRLSFSAETGVVSGSFVFPFTAGVTTVTYRGIALPGWQGCSACSASGSFVERPWADGSCSFTDRIGDAGVVRNGCEVWIGKYR